MKHYALLMATMGVAFLVLFGLVEYLGVPWLTDPGILSGSGRLAGALSGFSLLVADVVLPVPSSVVMIAHGALLGVWGGTLISLLGGTGAALFAFLLGRRGGRWVHRWVPEDERHRADRLLERWGSVAIIATRPVPILAECIAIVAGTSRMGWGRLTLAAVAGSLPASFLYALTGATAAQVDDALLILALVLSIAGLFWLGGRMSTARVRTQGDGERVARNMIEE